MVSEEFLTSAPLSTTGCSGKGCNVVGVGPEGHQVLSGFCSVSPTKLAFLSRTYVVLPRPRLRLDPIGHNCDDHLA